MNTKGLVGKIIYVIACVLTGIWVMIDGFIPLFVLLALLIGVAFMDFAKPKVNNEDVTYRSAIFACLIALFGFFSVMAFKQYVYPRKDVIKSNEYHALRVDGIALRNCRGFVLAGNSRNAFFDAETHNGSITIRDTSSRTVQLELNNFSEPVYLISGSQMRQYSLLNTASLVSFHDNDSVQLVHHDQTGDRIIGFRIAPGHINYKKWNLFKHDVDTAQYFFNGGVPSLETRFLKSGLPLSSLLAGTIPEFDPAGIQIIRGEINYDVKRNRIDTEYEGQPYYVSFTSESQITGIIVNGNHFARTSDCTIEIPIGEPFCIGFGTEKSETMCFGRKDGQLTLEYYLPRYRYLTANNPDNDDQTLMVTSSLFDAADDNMLGAYTENIALINQFSHVNNRYHMPPWYLSYSAGKAGMPINFSVYTDSTRLNQTSMDYYVAKEGGSWAEANAHTGDNRLRYQAYFRGISTVDGSADWLAGVENFQNTTPFPAKVMSRLLLLVIILSILSILLGKFSNNTVASGAEYAAYLIIIGFMSLRCFLQWRATVFPPVSSISFFEFNNFRDPKLLRFLKYEVIAFYVAVIVYKLFLALSGSKIRRPFTADTLQYNSRYHGIIGKFFAFLTWKWVFCMIMTACYIIPCILIPRGESQIARLANILLPVSLFFGFEFLIFRLYSRDYTQDIDLEVDNPIHYRLGPALLTILNIMLVAVYTFYRDGGFGVMFLLFGLIVSIYLVSDLRFYTREGHTRTENNWILYSELALFVFAAAFGFVYKRLFIWILDNRLAFCAGLFIALIIVFFLLSNVLEFKKDMKWWGWALSAAVAFSISLGVFFGASKLIDGTHLEFRTRVHMDHPAEIIQNNIDNFSSQNKFMQASLNDWILQEYSNCGEDVSPFHKSTYFKLQPQSKLGAMWFAQTTDIVLSRFVIAEHSSLLAILLVIVLFLFLVVASFGLCDHRYSRFIQIAVPLLLFIQAGLILFANLRMFVFFGQDFPLISITSKLSSLYFFILMGIFVISLLRERDYIEGGWRSYKWGAMPSNARSIIVEKDRGTNLKLIIAAGLCILIPTVISNIFDGKIGLKNKIRVSSLDGRYSLDSLMTSLDDARKSLDTLFVNYQATQRLELRMDMASQLEDFARTDEYRSFKESLDTTNRFAARVFDRYIRTGSHYNSSKGLVHIRKERSYDRRGQSHEHLVFDINNDFYEYQLPLRQTKSWKGSIIGDAQVSNRSGNTARNGNIDAVRLKNEWLDQDADLYLISTTGSEARVMGENSIVELNRNGLPVALVSGKDEIVRGNRNVTIPIINHDHYFARNVMVNGVRTFLYPYGSEMFWIREFANSIKLAKETMLRKGDQKEIEQSFDGNVPITISKDLSRAIYRQYIGNGALTDKTVVVADGDGHIKAMVDYRGDRQFRLNPNDEETIGRISDRLYMEGLKKAPVYQRYFTTFATSPLRLGPGSSQKPIVWSAVTSGYNSGFWNSLTILPLPTDPIQTRIGRNGRPFIDYYSGFHLQDGGRTGHFYFPFFAGQQIQRNFKSIAGDEGYSGIPITLGWYMYKSSNYYNAMMAYFGMFESAQLERLIPEELFSSVRADRVSDVEQKRELFPIMRTENLGTFSFARGLTRNEYLNPNALLPRGLSRYMGLPLKKRDAQNSLYESIPRYIQNKNDEYEARPSYREASFFNMDIRAEYTRPEEMLEVGIRTVAIGNNTSWNVSPLKMAEMYGRLISLNRNYTLSLDPSHSVEYEPFNLDTSWGTGHEAIVNYRQERKDFIQGMSGVFSNALVGTARNVYSMNNGLNQFGVFMDRDNDDPHTYYIYGKTGTINARWDGADRTDHLLSVIITNRKVATVEDLSDMKFYVIYFADYGTSAFELIDGEIVRIVIQSDDFQSYMNE